jgi:lysophospholipase L1-like esterase
MQAAQATTLRMKMTTTTRMRMMVMRMVNAMVTFPCAKAKVERKLEEVTVTIGMSWALLVHAESKPGDADFPTKNANSRHEEKVKAVQAGTFDLALIGDSITHTLGDMNDGKYAPNQAVWKRHFESRRAINLGMNGQRTEEILWNLQNGQLEFTQSPKVMVLLIGTNNADDRHFARTHSPEEIFAGTRAIVQLIRRRHPSTKILIVRIFPRGGDGEKGVSPPAFNSSARCIETCRRAGELTSRLADGQHVFWMDVNQVFFARSCCQWSGFCSWPTT